LLKAKPGRGPESIVTVTAYYFTFYPDRKEASAWKIFMSAVIFVQNNYEAGNLLLRGEIRILDAKEKYNLKLKEGTIKKYIEYLDLYGVTDSVIDDLFMKKDQ